MPEPSLFRHYQIVQDADGRNVELTRDSRQVAVLAFDTRRLEFAHCHVLLETLGDKAGFEKGCQRLQENGNPLLARVLDFGEDEGNPYLITSHVDGETLGQYLGRQTELPAWLAASVAARALEAAAALLERGDFLPHEALASLRLVQTGASTVQAQVCDYALPAKAGARVLPHDFEKQARFLRAMFQEQAGEGPDAAGRMVPGADLAELLAGCLGAAGADTRDALKELRASLLKLEAAAGEIPTAHKPRSLLAGHLATYQEVARGVVNQVRIQSQRLDMASPYSMRGILTKTGRTVLVEQVPPARLVGEGPLEECRKALRLDKRKQACLVPVVLVQEGEDLTCLGEEVVEGIHLMDLLRERRALDVQEVYLVLAGLDTALSSLEKSGMETRRLRLEDIYLLTGFVREDGRSAKLLHTRLTDWPAFTIMLRAHPTLAAMAGRGLNPAALLPPVSESWSGSWLAAAGCFLLGVEALPGSEPPAEGTREREAAGQLFREELARARTRADSRSGFLARLARIVQPNGKARAGQEPTPAKKEALVEIKPRPRQQRTVPMGTPAAISSNVAPIATAPLTTGISPLTEKPTIGFAELLFRDTPSMETSSGPDWAKTAADAPPTIHPDEVLLPEGDYVPFWLRASVFVGGSMILGAAFAHFSGKAQWQKPMAPVPSPAVAVERAAPAPQQRQVIVTQPDPPAAPAPDLSALPAMLEPVPGPNLLPPPPGLRKDILREPK